jgi:hypothetical protein
MDINYTEAQQQVFFNPNPTRYTIVTKGRRVGLTRGAAQALIEYALSGVAPRMLWGETIYSNVQRYMDLYFLPILKQLPPHSWRWQSKMMQLTIMDSIIDFRSADSPEMWEGFGYHIIYLNEAGIILRNPELYKKTVLPMLMDYPNSRLIAAGVPKGKKIKNGEIHPFYELWENGATSTAYTRYKFSSYSNPFLRASDIKDIEDVLDDKTKLQEIHGEFIDTTDNPYLYSFEASNHVTNGYEPNPHLPLWFSFDFNVDPNSCIIGQQPTYKSGVVFDEISVKGSTDLTCDQLIAKYSHWISKGIVFITGDATGKNRNAISGELTNYKVIKQRLKLIDSQMKQKNFNMLLDSSRVLCNSVLAKGDIRVVKSCKQLIADCQIASVNGKGELVKDSGLHKLDCFRYLIESWFPDFLEKSYKYK